MPNHYDIDEGVNERSGIPDELVNKFGKKGDGEIAAEIRDAVSRLNILVGEAAKQGILTEYDLHTRNYVGSENSNYIAVKVYRPL